jgi:hypothetical protein
MRAYIDESYEAGPNGLYVLAAVLAHDDDTEVRAAMLALRERWHGQSKVHFRKANAKLQRRYLETVSQLDRTAVAVLAEPCRHPERTRRKALVRLLWELKSRVGGVVLEHRTTQLDRDDQVVVQSAAAGLRYEFRLGRERPVLWAADCFASGLFQANHRGTSWMSEILGQVEEHRIRVD